MSKQLSKQIDQGVNKIKNVDTWKKVGQAVLGSLGAQVAVLVGRKVGDLITTNQTLGYALGTATSAATAIGCFAFKQEQAGYGAITVAAAQAIATISVAVTGKPISDLTA
jgi:hypothetical protein